MYNSFCGLKMYKINDIVTYGTTGVCKIIDIRKQKIGKKEMQYYILQPSFQKTATVYVPIANEALVAKIKPVMSKQEINILIKAMPEIGSEWIDDENKRAERFKEIINSCDKTEIVKLIKTIYFHQQALFSNGKKLRRMDEIFLQEAEALLYNEFATVLNIKPEEVLPMIIKELDWKKRQNAAFFIGIV